MSIELAEFVRSEPVRVPSVDGRLPNLDEFVLYTREATRASETQEGVADLGGMGNRDSAGMSRELLKLSGSLVHDYATISDDSPSPNRASRARRAVTSAGIS